MERLKQEDRRRKPAEEIIEVDAFAELVLSQYKLFGEEGKSGVSDLFVAADVHFTGLTKAIAGQEWIYNSRNL